MSNNGRHVYPCTLKGDALCSQLDSARYFPACQLLLQNTCMEYNYKHKIHLLLQFAVISELLIKMCQTVSEINKQNSSYITRQL